MLLKYLGNFLPLFLFSFYILCSAWPFKKISRLKRDYFSFDIRIFFHLITDMYISLSRKICLLFYFRKILQKKALNFNDMNTWYLLSKDNSENSMKKTLLNSNTQQN